MSKKTPKPTDGELAILAVLWRLGPCTVREVHTQLSDTQETGYTTVLKLMQIMAEKGIVTRDESRKTHVYAAAIREEDVQGRFLGDLIARVFHGSTQNLVLRALSTKKASADDLASIRKLIDDMEKGGK
jgi:predicted transcriptional regulator